MCLSQVHEHIVDMVKYWYLFSPSTSHSCLKCFDGKFVETRPWTRSGHRHLNCFFIVFCRLITLNISHGFSQVLNACLDKFLFICLHRQSLNSGSCSGLCRLLILSYMVLGIELVLDVLLHLVLDDPFIHLWKTIVHFVLVQVLKHFPKPRVVWLGFEFHVLYFQAEEAQFVTAFSLAHALKGEALLVSLDELHSLIIVDLDVGRYVEYWQIIIIQ